MASTPFSRNMKKQVWFVRSTGVRSTVDVRLEGATCQICTTIGLLKQALDSAPQYHALSLLQLVHDGSIDCGFNAARAFLTRRYTNDCH
jgi:hypothetical protein